MAIAAIMIADFTEDHCELDSDSWFSVAQCRVEYITVPGTTYRASHTHGLMFIYFWVKQAKWTF